jgi:hypothetical protein
MPRAKLTPTEEQRQRVRSLSAYGIEPEDIARYLHMSEKTLLKYYGEELFRGRFEANAKVGQTLFEMATSGEMPAATIFWQKARGGWRENHSADPRPVAPPDFVVVLDKKAA